MDYLGCILSKKITVLDLFGIEFNIHSSVIVIPVLLVMSGNLNLGMVIYVLGIAISVLMHEMGHALVSYLVGNPAKEICLIACGGYTLFDRNPGVTGKDALMSLAGPMVNGLICTFMIGIGIVSWGGSFGEWIHVLISQIMGDDLETDGAPLWIILLNDIAFVNASMLVFNLVPAFPLDRGRILRWLTGCFLPSQKAAFTTMLVACSLACLNIIRSIIGNLIVDFDPMNFIMMALITGWVLAGSIYEFYRTKLLCEAEAGSAEAILKLRMYFDEVYPFGRRQ